MHISVRPFDVDAPIGELGALAARLELVAGTLTMSRGELVIRIPLEPAADGVIAAFPQSRRVKTPDAERRALP